MISAETALGGSVYWPITAPTESLAMGRGRVFRLAVSGAGIGAEVDLPDARTVPLGWPPLYIFAEGGGVTIQDGLGSPLFNLADGEVVRLACVDNSAADGLWSWSVRTEGAPPAPAFETVAARLGGDGALDDVCEEYTPSSDAWAALATANRDLVGASVATDGRKAWAFGSTSFSDQDKIEEYDRLSDAWSTKATDYPIIVQRPGAVFRGGFVYVFGGGQSAGDERKAYRYNPNEETFQALEDVPGTDTEFRAVMIGSRMHVLGDNSHFVYDPDADAYESLAVRPGGLRNFAVAFYFDRLVAVGGDDGGGLATSAQPNVDWYSYASDKWTAYPDLPAGRTRAGAVHIGARTLLVFGGDDGTGGFGKKSDLYSFDASSWSTRASLPGAVTDLHGVSVPLIA